MSTFAPKVKVELADDGVGNQTVASLSGDDADEFEPYLDHYLQQGHEPAAATRLAKAEWAAEAAVEAGVIRETTNKRNQRVNQIMFPSKPRNSFEIELCMHMARVKAAADFLDHAKMVYLRQKSTCNRVALAHEKWLEQVERILNLQNTVEEE